MRPALLILSTLALGAELAPEPGTVTGRLRAMGFRAEGAVVYLTPVDQAPAPEQAVDTAVMDQFQLRFVPRVLPVPLGATVQFRNSDALLHNVFSPPGATGGFDLGTYPQGDLRSRTFREPGVRVILCHLHPDMVAYVVVIPATRYAVADADGAFDISNVAPGRYRLHVWHRRATPLTRAVTVGDGERLHVDLVLTPAARR